MTDILEFLEARLVDDEVVVHGMQREAVRVQTAPVFQGHPMVDWLTRVDIFVSPDRLLAEVAAKRQLIADAGTLTHYYNDDDPWYSCSQSIEGGHGDHDEEALPGNGCADEDRAGQPCDCGRDAQEIRTLSILASVYAGHPDYDPAWTIPQ